MGVPVSIAQPGSGSVAHRLALVPRARRLPAVPVPVEGEAFASWIDRTAFELGVGPGLLAQRLGLECRPSSATTRPLLFGIMLTAESLRGVQEATGLAADRLRAMHLEHYAGGALDFTGLYAPSESSVRSWAIREWAQVHSSRACARCLAEGTVWPLWWRLQTAAVCPRHSCLLVDSCPACGIRLRRGNAGHPRGLLSRPGALDPALCGNRVPGSAEVGGLCPQPLAQIAAPDVHPALVQAQNRVLAAAAFRQPQLLGEQVTAAEWFAALRLLAAVARRAASAEDLSACETMPPEARESLAAVLGHHRSAARGGMHAVLRAGPAEATEAAGLLALLDPVLACTEPQEARDLLAPWVAVLAERRRAAKGTDPFRGLPRPRLLDELLAEAMPRSNRVAGALTHRRNPPAPPLHLHQIPHLVRESDYAELIAEHLPATAPTSGRRLAALAVARLCGAGSWPEAAALLGMDARRAARVSDTLVRRINDAGAFWKAVRLLAERMRASGPVDYQERRTLLDDLTEVPHRVLFAILHPLGRDVTRQRQLHAAAWVWQQLTGGDVREAPAYRHGWTGASEESVREGCRRFAARLPPQAADALTAWGEELLNQHQGRAR
ncbi:TniQ family protein [Kitasatospora sp. NPDC094015]|uniref:TniQ family protein n=1 Tax=Kitasatospora sp. NPDC094015 TaxID=3155205 RepID=UPI0033332AF1